MWSFVALCDEFCCHTRLYYKLDLNPSRETLVHFMERVRKSYPRMTRLRKREDGTLLLDDDGGDENRARRYLRIESSALKFGAHGAASPEGVRRFGDTILSQAPHHLGTSDLELDYMDVVMVFELEYRGNHDQLIAETILPDHPLLRALTDGDQRIIDCQPFFGVTLTPGCERQVFVEVRGRTTTGELRSEEYERHSLAVHLTARRYWGSGEPLNPQAAFRELLSTAEQYAIQRVVPCVVQPLAAAISSSR